MLSKEHYEEYFDGYHIVDAVVRNRSHFYFVLKKIDSQQSDDDESLNRIVRVTGFYILRDNISGRRTSCRR